MLNKKCLRIYWTRYISFDGILDPWFWGSLYYPPKMTVTLWPFIVRYRWSATIGQINSVLRDMHSWFILFSSRHKRLHSHIAFCSQISSDGLDKVSPFLPHSTLLYMTLKSEKLKIYAKSYIFYSPQRHFFWTQMMLSII